MKARTDVTGDEQEAGGTSASQSTEGKGLVKTLIVTQQESLVIQGSVTDPWPQMWSPSTLHLQ